MAPRSYSWGNLPAVEQTVYPVYWRDQPLPSGPQSLLPWGLGRSYGDSCVNDRQAVLAMRELDRIISFDRSAGVLECESGVSLAEILNLVVPAGWFLPVTPGTKFVTVGGAIANDVHGKNHERVGSFGNHVRSFKLLRSVEGEIECTPERNEELFRATIGGLGLTGAILSAELHLRRIDNPFVTYEAIKFADLDEFQKLCAESKATHEYVVAWLDCVSKGARLGRGILSRGNHADEQHNGLKARKRVKLSVPVYFPSHALNAWTVRAFNDLYYRRQRQTRVSGIAHYDPFLYQLDSLHSWNKIYGRRGFYQYQCVVGRNLYSAITRILEAVSRAGAGSFLAVLKEFGAIESLGMLSFPREGVTLALDFPNRGARTLGLLEKLDAIVMAAGGAVYPAKDARMSASAFSQYFPQWEAFRGYADPKFSSSFWRRVTETECA